MRMWQEVTRRRVDAVDEGLGEHSRIFNVSVEVSQYLSISRRRLLTTLSVVGVYELV